MWIFKDVKLSWGKIDEMTHIVFWFSEAYLLSNHEVLRGRGMCLQKKNSTWPYNNLDIAAYTDINVI